VTVTAKFGFSVNVTAKCNRVGYSVTVTAKCGL